MAPPTLEDQSPEIDYLLSLPRFAGRTDEGFKPGLERIEALLEAMGRPHEAYPSVHVAGTNGKGSTASFVAAILSASGRRAGLHTSPHLFRVSERMRVDGWPAPADWLSGAVGRYRDLFETVKPSFFEATVALSLLHFAEAKVDAAVVEVGLGGRLDATNVLRPALAIITHVGLDHTELLGETLAEIAREKAGIIKPGAPVVTGVTPPDALAVLRTTAAERGAPLHVVAEEVTLERAEAGLRGSRLWVRTPERHYEALEAGLGGRPQQQNALLAVRAAELLDLPEEAIRRGLRDVRRLSGLRGRGEVLQERPLVVADVAHNPEGLAAALSLVREGAPEGRLTVLLGLMRDKDLASIIPLLRSARPAAVVPVPFDTPRALPAEELADRLEEEGLKTEPAAPVPEALARFRQSAAPKDALLITGSHYVVAQLPAEE